MRSNRANLGARTPVRSRQADNRAETNRIPSPPNPRDSGLNPASLRTVCLNFALLETQRTAVVLRDRNRDCVLRGDLLGPRAARTPFGLSHKLSFLRGANVHFGIVVAAVMAAAH